MREASAYSAGMDNDTGQPEQQEVQRKKLHYLYLAIGWFFVVVGFIGAFLPVLPTTPFLLISAWAFSQSSEKLHRWLHEHPRFGSYLVAWSQYRAIPKSGKLLSVTMMSLGWVYVFLTWDDWVLPTILGLTHVIVGTYIVTRPSGPPANAVAAGSPDSQHTETQ